MGEPAAAEDTKAHQPDQPDTLLGGEYEVITLPKRGILFVEARVRDDLDVEVDTATVSFIRVI